MYPRRKHRSHTKTLRSPHREKEEKQWRRSPKLAWVPQGPKDTNQTLYGAENNIKQASASSITHHIKSVRDQS